ncbi:MATE family efflux transporter, partial [Enterococcus faecium]|uniref:MATE family efflux transporter n=1 Tax=Enterococcus faecium TaxID=1352 RepID=UPI003CC5E680
AMATFTAQNNGAKEYGPILQGVRQTLLMSVGFSHLAGAIVIFFGHFFVQLVGSPSETREFELAQTHFNINGSLYWILAV